MKSIFLLLMLYSLIFHTSAQTDKAIFLHHSTGGGVFFEGDVSEWIVDYNIQHGTSLEVTEFSYPNSPWGWENYPFDYWKLWIDGSCNNSLDNIQCLDKLCQNNELIIFKHCFPGAGIEADNGNGDVTSPAKTLNNYKLQYRALLALFDQYPNNKFMVWTLAPLHRNATNSDQANRAAQFVDWVKNTWLTEDGNQHLNVVIFDFFGLAAEQNANPAQGEQYCLKYEYEGNHNGSDSHPNTLANQTIGPLFAADIAAELTESTSGIEINIPEELFLISTDKSKQIIIYNFVNSVPQKYLIEVFSANGNLLISERNCSSNGVIHLKGKTGLFLIRTRIGGKFISKKVIL